MHYILDAYAWIEYFRGSDKGKRVKAILESKNNTCLTAKSTISEVSWWALQHKANLAQMIIVIKNRSTIVDINLNLWIDGAKQKFDARKRHKDFGILDALLLAMSETTGATIITGDPHFAGRKNVLML